MNWQTQYSSIFCYGWQMFCFRSPSTRIGTSRAAHYECMNDCADMSSYLSRCHSCRVESGCFMVYDRNNYMGQQYFMRRGEYNDMQRMMSMGMMFDNIRSCRMIPYVRQLTTITLLHWTVTLTQFSCFIELACDFDSADIFSESLHYSTKASSGWRSTRGRTSVVSPMTWWTTVTMSRIITACPTASPARWRTATGWCTSRPTTEAGWCTWGLETTRPSRRWWTGQRFMSMRRITDMC